MMAECPLCKRSTLKPNTRLIKDSCGHTKCRMCLLKEEDGCDICKREKTGIPREILSINHSLPITLPESYFSRKIILNLTQSNNPIKSLSYSSDRITISEISNDAESQMEIEPEEENSSQIVKSPNQLTNGYKSPEFNMSDYLLFKNPYANSRLNTELRISNCIVIKSPTRTADLEKSNSCKSPVRYLGNNSPNGDYLILSKNSPVQNETMEQAIYCVLNDNGEVVVSQNMEASSSAFKKFAIDCVLDDDKDENEKCEIREIDEDKENKDESKKIKTRKSNKRRRKRSTKGDSKPKRRKRNKDWSHIDKLPPEDSNRYKCTVCQKSFKNLQNRVYHAACRLGMPPYRCTFDGCERTFTKRSHFEYHERVHTGDKPFECDVCKKRFIQKNKLLRHVTGVHGQQKEECGKCGKKFSSREYLKLHELVHQANTFECRFCDKSFTLDVNRKRHERSHSSDRPYQCDVCSSNFKSKFLLTRHKRIHDKKRPFSCKHCHQTFLSKSEVQRHVTRHSDEKLYSCKECEVDFGRKDNLKRHIKHHHSGKQFDKLIVIKKSQESRPKSTPSVARPDVTFDLPTEKSKTVAKKPISIVRLDEISDRAKGIKLTDPIPLEDVQEINRKIEASLDSQIDETNFTNNNKERSKTGRESKKNDENNATNNTASHVHWRRRITVSFQNF